MKYKKPSFYAVVLMGASLTMPVLASAGRLLQYSEENRNAPSPFILKVQSTERWEADRPDLGGKGIYSYSSDELSSGTWGGKVTGEGDRSSDKDTRSYSEPLGPSFDIPDSVDGRSRAVNPWWDRRSSADPMVQDLSRMDSGISGSASPGSSLGR